MNMHKKDSAYATTYSAWVLQQEDSDEAEKTFDVAKSIGTPDSLTFQNPSMSR